MSAAPLPSARFAPLTSPIARSVYDWPHSSVVLYNYEYKARPCLHTVLRALCQLTMERSTAEAASLTVSRQPPKESGHSKPVSSRMLLHSLARWVETLPQGLPCLEWWLHGALEEGDSKPSTAKTPKVGHRGKQCCGFPAWAISSTLLLFLLPLLLILLLLIALPLIPLLLALLCFVPWSGLAEEYLASVLDVLRQLQSFPALVAQTARKSEFHHTPLLFRCAGSEPADLLSHALSLSIAAKAEDAPYTALLPPAVSSPSSEDSEDVRHHVLSWQGQLRTAESLLLTVLEQDLGMLETEAPGPVDGSDQSTEEGIGEVVCFTVAGRKQPLLALPEAVLHSLPRFSPFRKVVQSGSELVAVAALVGMWRTCHDVLGFLRRRVWFVVRDEAMRGAGAASTGFEGSGAAAVSPSSIATPPNVSVGMEPASAVAAAWVKFLPFQGEYALAWLAEEGAPLCFGARTETQEGSSKSDLEWKFLQRAQREMMSGGNVRVLSPFICLGATWEAPSSSPSSTGSTPTEAAGSGVNGSAILLERKRRLKGGEGQPRWAVSTVKGRGFCRPPPSTSSPSDSHSQGDHDHHAAPPVAQPELRMEAHFPRLSLSPLGLHTSGPTSAWCSPLWYGGFVEGWLAQQLTSCLEQLQFTQALGLLLLALHERLVMIPFAQPQPPAVVRAEEYSNAPESPASTGSFTPLSSHHRRHSFATSGPSTELSWDLPSRTRSHRPGTPNSLRSFTTESTHRERYEIRVPGRITRRSRGRTSSFTGEGSIRSAESIMSGHDDRVEGGGEGARNRNRNEATGESTQATASPSADEWFQWILSLQDAFPKEAVPLYSLSSSHVDAFRDRLQEAAAAVSSGAASLPPHTLRNIQSIHRDGFHHLLFALLFPHAHAAALAGEPWPVVWQTLLLLSCEGLRQQGKEQLLLPLGSDDKAAEPVVKGGMDDGCLSALINYWRVWRLSH